MSRRRLGAVGRIPWRTRFSLAKEGLLGLGVLRTTGVGLLFFLSLEAPEEREVLGFCGVLFQFWRRVRAFGGGRLSRATAI